MKKLKKHIQWVTRRGGPGGREGVVALGVIAGLISLEVGMVCAEHDLSYYFAPFRVNLNTSKSLSVKIKLHEDLLSILNCLVHKSRLSHLLRLLIFISNKNVGYVKEPRIQFSVT